MTIGERIRIIREHTSDKKLSMASFAEKLGVTSGAVSQWENNQKTPSNAVVVLICREFNIDENWLRTGEGEMMKSLDREDEIARIASQMLDETEPAIRNAMHRIIADASEDDLKLILEYARRLVEEMDEKDPPVE